MTLAGCLIIFFVKSGINLSVPTGLLQFCLLKVLGLKWDLLLNMAFFSVSNFPQCWTVWQGQSAFPSFPLWELAWQPSFWKGEKGSYSKSCGSAWLPGVSRLGSGSSASWHGELDPSSKVSSSGWGCSGWCLREASEVWSYSIIVLKGIPAFLSLTAPFFSQEKSGSSPHGAVSMSGKSLTGTACKN